MSKQDTPSTMNHEVRLIRVDAQEQSAHMNEFTKQQHARGKQVRPLPTPTSIDEFLNLYPEARQIQPTISCPVCGVEIPIPHGSLRAYVEYIKATDPNAGEGPYNWAIRSGCRIGMTVKRSDLSKGPL